MTVKILIVENNKSIAHDLQERLLSFGYEVVGTCSSSKEAIHSIKSLTPDILIMNVRLQRGTDGIKTGELVPLLS
ncbi:MAG: response regulator [Anaerolineales bacterium]